MLRTFQYLSIAALVMILAGNAIAQSDDSQTWERMPGTAVDIAINIDGQAYVTSPDGTPWRWDKVEQRWRRMSGDFQRITAAEGNRPWAIDSENVVFRYNGLWWEEKDTDVKDVAADTNGNVYIAKTNGDLRKWYSLRSEWHPVERPGNVRRLAVSPDGALWVILEDGRIRSFDKNEWKDYPGRALDIALGGTDAVMIVDQAGLVRTWDITRQSWIAVPGLKEGASLALTPEGRAWVVAKGGEIWANGTIVAEQAQSTDDAASNPQAVVPTARTPLAITPKATVEVADVPAPPIRRAIVPSATPTQNPTSNPKDNASASIVSIDPVTITTKSRITFTDTRQSIKDLAIGADGSVFGLADGGTLMRWSNEQRKFKEFPGSLVRLAVDGEGNPWGVSALGRIFRHDGRRWNQIQNVTAVDIAIGYDGTVIAVNASEQLLKLNEQQTGFNVISGNGISVALAPDGTPWTIRSDKLIQRCDSSPCDVLPQKALSLSIGPDGSVWIVSDRNILMRLKSDGKSFERVSTPGHTPWKVAVGPNGYPWVVSDARFALASHYFPRDEQADVKVAVSTTGDTTGSGATTSVSVSSVSSFTFSKNMQFETVSTSTLSNGQLALLASDNEGVIWATTQGGAMDKYSESQKKMINADTKFTSDGADINSFDIAPNGDIWAHTSNPNTGYFRERNKVHKKYTVSGLSDGSRLAVSPDGSVYAVFYDNASTYIYVKAADSEIFKRFAQTQMSQMSVGPGNDVWITDGNNYVRQWNGTSFVKRPSTGLKASKIAVGKTDGTVYITDFNNLLYKWNGTNKSFDKVNNVTARYIAVDEDGRPWINTDTTPTIKRARD